MRCITFGCRSLERSCTHVQLTRALTDFTPSRSGAAAVDKDATSCDSARSGDDADHPMKASSSFRKYSGSIDADQDDHDIILDVDSSRQKRNLLPCVEEQKTADMWLRTADLTATRVALGAEGSSSPAAASAFDSFLRCGLVFDPSDVLTEARCIKCGSEKELNTALEVKPALVYTPHATAPPLTVSDLIACRPFTSLLVVRECSVRPSMLRPPSNSKATSATMKDLIAILPVLMVRLLSSLGYAGTDMQLNATAVSTAWSRCAKSTARRINWCLPRVCATSWFPSCSMDAARTPLLRLTLRPRRRASRCAASTLRAWAACLWRCFAIVQRLFVAQFAKITQTTSFSTVGRWASVVGRA